MKQSIFTILGKYKSSKELSPEENYSTELLAYLLNYSLKIKSDLFKYFMNLLGENIELIKYDDFVIETQLAFTTTSNKLVISDIAIRRASTNEVYLIEVKVESGLNYYENPANSKDTINQIEKYQLIIKSKKKIYLLTKYICAIDFSSCQDFEGKLKWADIHLILEYYNSNNQIENYLVKETIKYLEEKNMSIPKVSYELVKGMESLNNLLHQIEMALEGIPFKGSFGSEWLGYYLYRNEKLKKVKSGYSGWVGTYYDGTKVSFEYTKNRTKSLSESELKKFDLIENKEHYVAHFDLENNKYFCLSPENQMKTLQKWIDLNYKRLL